MKNKFKISPRLLATLIVPIGIFFTLVIYTFFLGNNHLLIAAPFWFIIVPVLASYLPLIFIKKGNTLLPTLMGLIIFYLFMVWMIYKHYKSDAFQVMMISAAFNVIIITLIGLSKHFLNKWYGNSANSHNLL